jgi:hypothetical protein
MTDPHTFGVDVVCGGRKDAVWREDYDRLAAALLEMTAAVRDAGVLLATADPSSDLPDQEAADLWSTAAVNWLKQHEELIVTPPVKPR